MSKYDRLSVLITRFSLKVIPAWGNDANLIVFENTDSQLPTRIRLSTQVKLDRTACANERPLFSARTEWGGDQNPLFAALPESIELVILEDKQLIMLVELIKAEAEAERCGSDMVLNRLGEVLMVRLLRAQLEQGTTAVGLLGGLADSRLSRAIVAIHESPGKRWRNEDMAFVANLSLSRFAELFQRLVGETPQAYLRRWRMTLARQDVERGERIQTVAHRYGYGSSEALSRAFRRQFGDNPVSLR